VIFGIPVLQDGEDVNHLELNANGKKVNAKTIRLLVAGIF